MADHYAKMSAEDRMQMASDMFDSARTIVESSLPIALTRRERRLMLARRLYAQELPEAALNAFADWPQDP